jgi:hypothetical protein
LRAQKCYETGKTRSREAAQQNFGKRGGKLAFDGTKRRTPVYEVNRQISRFC